MIYSFSRIGAASKMKVEEEIATEWLWTYNHERPNMGIGGVTPAQKLKMAA
ncbi:hypothetical protein PY650_20180 [Rhizobium calliandrae]|uniref:Integrase catalytic domain-containing protein n=1 Tax=Rhizobium calliandrae TaxID=1312182 RepID=A0ABT7KH27_9HYPH|nr:hypothetical protein [Rhizobium calliandrae]MDL2407937.1 hypothetical protein [Rhizobium calliandrae]